MVSDTEQGDARTERPGRRKSAKPAARPVQRGATATTCIYRDLRNDIVSLRRKPGEPIVEKQVAQAYGVSRTPVREAMLKLADDGLIEVFPQSGTFVSRIPIADLPEAIAIRKALEQTTVRMAAERATRSQIARLRVCLEVQREREAADDHEGFHQSDEEFHALIAETAGFPRFWTIVQQVKVQVDRYRRLTLPVRGRMGVVIEEHEAMLDAIADHDPERAVRALNVHLNDLETTIAEAQRANPLYFTDRKTT
jgi:DNA-binding GntR family transcriptional regulator